ncbi:hypothetical protein G6F65_017974 [Rhizopus arrhizus]|nr:hypothetical protein G6F65_017974 [Rhizopus arrhizus]
MLSVVLAAAIGGVGPVGATVGGVLVVVRGGGDSAAYRGCAVRRGGGLAPALDGQVGAGDAPAVAGHLGVDAAAGVPGVSGIGGVSAGQRGGDSLGDVRCDAACAAVRGAVGGAGCAMRRGLGWAVGGGRVRLHDGAGGVGRQRGLGELCGGGGTVAVAAAGRGGDGVGPADTGLAGAVCRVGMHAAIAVLEAGPSGPWPLADERAGCGAGQRHPG